MQMNATKSKSSALHTVAIYGTFLATLAILIFNLPETSTPVKYELASIILFIGVMIPLYVARDRISPWMRPLLSDVFFILRTALLVYSILGALFASVFFLWRWTYVDGVPVVNWTNLLILILFVLGYRILKQTYADVLEWRVKRAQRKKTPQPRDKHRSERKSPC